MYIVSVYFLFPKEKPFLVSPIFFFFSRQPLSLSCHNTFKLSIICRIGLNAEFTVISFLTLCPFSRMKDEFFILCKPLCPRVSALRQREKKDEGRMRDEKLFLGQVFWHSCQLSFSERVAGFTLFWVKMHTRTSTLAHIIIFYARYSWCLWYADGNGSGIITVNECYLVGLFVSSLVRNFHFPN